MDFVGAREGFGVEIEYSTMLWVAIAANMVALVTQPLWAIVSDRIGRKPVFIFGCLACGVMVWAYYAAVTAHNIPLVCPNARSSIRSPNDDIVIDAIPHPRQWPARSRSTAE